MMKQETDEEIAAKNAQSVEENARVDNLAYSLDKVLSKFEETATAMAESVASGVVPAYIAAECIKKWKQGLNKLYETVPNQQRLQLVLSLEELRKERGGYVQEIERAPVTLDLAPEKEE
jgi:hypothetical protein